MFQHEQNVSGLLSSDGSTVSSHLHRGQSATLGQVNPVQLGSAIRLMEVSTVVYVLKHAVLYFTHQQNMFRGDRNIKQYAHFTVHRLHST